MTQLEYSFAPFMRHFENDEVLRFRKRKLQLVLQDDMQWMFEKAAGEVVSHVVSILHVNKASEVPSEESFNNSMPAFRTYLAGVIHGHAQEAAEKAKGFRPLIHTKAEHLKIRSLELNVVSAFLLISVYVHRTFMGKELIFALDFEFRNSIPFMMLLAKRFEQLGTSKDKSLEKALKVLE